MESWDHPGKEPYLIFPDIHLCWNDDLREETKKIQGIDKTGIICPLKFRYIKERVKKDLSEMKLSLSNNLKEEINKLFEIEYLLYPMCTSSKYYGFEGEINFLKILAHSLKSSDRKLLVRPYPLAPIHDINYLNDIDNIIISEINSCENGADVLNEEYLDHKYLSIIQAQAVINVGTTFALDAALCNIPVHQIKITGNDFGNFSEYSRGEHIKKFLWLPFAYEIYKKQDLMSLNFNSDQAIQFSKSLKNWIKWN